MKKMKSSEKIDTIIVINFGGQYAHLIARRIREQKVYSEIISSDTCIDGIRNLENRYRLKGIILSGGPSSVYEENAPKLDSRILNLNLPILGICYGHQLLAEMLGGKVKPGEKGEYGRVKLSIIKPENIMENIKGPIRGWMSHRDTVVGLPSEYEIIAKTENCPIASFSNIGRNIYGLQWHPEVNHSEYGDKIFKNFLFRICDCKPNWEMKDFVKKAISDIKKRCGDGRSIIAVSGGIDSTAAAVLSSKALGKKLIAVFVNHGLMREDESKEVREILRHCNLKLTILDQEDRFLKKLKGIKDPEEKRKIIGNEFIKTFEEIAGKEQAEYLIQGTIYPDKIESGTEKNSNKIKSHHNVGGIPTNIKFKEIIEPFQNLYKDEVRKIAQSLEMPKKIINRQPFPGPGLSVRIIGEITREKTRILRKAEVILSEEIRNTDIKQKLWQYFPILLSTKSTGVKGDARDYGYTIAIRAVVSADGMTANFARIPYSILERASNRMTNEIPEITRVVYDITNKPPATIEWE